MNRPIRKQTARDRQQTILKHFQTLGVAIKAEELDRALHEAEKQSASYLEMLDLLLSEQAEASPLMSR